jgi:transketolase
MKTSFASTTPAAVCNSDGEHLSESLEREWTNSKADELAREFRYVVTDMICRAGSGHIGGALSLVEILISLYYRTMRVRPEEPRWPDRDRLVLSKGHAGPILYTALAYKGYFPKQWLATMNRDGTRLPSHVDQIRTPGIDMTAGSLGQGLSCACGVALAGKMNRKDYRTFCIIGDGESNEGQIWEAAMFAAHWKLDNLVAITDRNQMQIDGRTDEILEIAPLADKWRAFNWEVFEIDGHDWDQIHSALEKAISVEGRPAMIVANTVKGKGNSVVEDRVDSHHVGVPDRAAYDKFIAGLGHTCTLPYSD